MPFAELNGYHIYYQERGQGAPVLLLHHGLGSTRAWDNLIPTLAQRYHVIVNDRRGYGRSDPRDRFELDFLQRDAEDTAQFLRELGMDRAHVIGHSDGGSIAIYLTALYPDLVRTLVLEAAHAWTQEGMDLPLIALKHEVDKNPPAWLTLPHGARWRKLFDAWIENWTSPGWREWDIRPLLAKIKAPTLIVQGDRDKFAPVSHAQAIAAGIPHSELWIVPDCGHTPHVEKAEEFQRQVLAFLQKHEGS